MNRTSVALVALLLGLTTAGCHRRHHTRVVYLPAMHAVPAPVVQAEQPPVVEEEEAPPAAPAPPPRVQPAPRQVIVPAPAPQMSARATVVIVVPPMAPPPAYAPAPRAAPQQPQQGNGAWFDTGE
jgi:hypothetical protein